MCEPWHQLKNRRPNLLWATYAVEIIIKYLEIMSAQGRYLMRWYRLAVALMQCCLRSGTLVLIEQNFLGEITRISPFYLDRGNRMHSTPV
jgi:hypothetical protein